MTKVQTPTSLEDRLKEVATRLGKSYLAWKSNETKKNKGRKEFFELATEDLSQNLAEDVVSVAAQDEDDARDLITKMYPGWMIEALRPHPDEEGSYEAIIREDPALMPYAYEGAGFKIKRSARKGSAYVDDERLREEDPELWNEVTEIPYKALIEDLLYNTGMHWREFEDEYEGQEPFWEREWVQESLKKHGLEPRLKDLDSLEPEVLARLQKYIFEGKPSVSLSTVAKVKVE